MNNVPNTTTPIAIRGPFLIGDTVRFKGTRRVATVAGFNVGILIRFKNGEMQQTTADHIEFIYHR